MAVVTGGAGERAPYDRIVSAFDAARTRLRDDERRCLDLVMEPLGPGSTVLDLGCGTGRPIAEEIASRGHAVVGVDASAAMLETARRRLPGHRWVHADIETVDLDETFDAAICWDALFHVPRTAWPRVIRRLRGWLRPGARLMLSSGGAVEPDGDGFTDTMFGHVFYYDSLPPDTLLALLEEVGFDLVLAEMCDQPSGGRNKGKWATVAARRDQATGRGAP